MAAVLVIRELGDAANDVARNPSSPNVSINNNAQMPMPYPRRDPEHLFPITNIFRIMRRNLPPNARVSEEAKSTIQECVSDYINFITAEANERCRREHRKTITAEDLLYAHANLGFDNYIGPITLYLERYRQNEAAQNSVHGDPSVRRTTIFSNVHTQGHPSMLAPTPSPLPPINSTFPIGADEQAFFNQTPMSNEFYFQNASGASHGDGFDVVGPSSNAEFPRAFFPHNFHPGPTLPHGSDPHGLGPDGQ
nr:nuclear transcription factor Y subunit B-8-like [Coffea arabica]